MQDPALRLKDLVNSDDWKEFVEIIHEHKESLNFQALLEIQNRDFEKAYGLRLRAIEAAKILQAVNGRLSELKKTGTEEDKDDGR